MWKLTVNLIVLSIKVCNYYNYLNSFWVYHKLLFAF